MSQKTPSYKHYHNTYDRKFVIITNTIIKNAEKKPAPMKLFIITANTQLFVNN